MSEQTFDKAGALQIATEIAKAKKLGGFVSRVHALLAPQLQDDKSYTTQELAEIAGGYASIDDITKAVKDLKPATLATTEKPAGEKPKTDAATSEKLAEDGSKPATMDIIKSFIGWDDWEKLREGREKPLGMIGGFVFGGQNIVIFLLNMFANIISGGKAYVEDQKPTPQNTPQIPEQQCFQASAEQVNLSPRETPSVGGKIQSRRMV